MSYYPKVLFVDDDARYAKTLQQRVYITHKIELIHFESWEEARSELLENCNKYSAVVLDALGKVNMDQSGDNQKHVMVAIRDLAKSGRNIPYYILTARLYEFIREDGSELKEGSRTVDIIRYFSDKIHRVPEGIYHNIIAIYQTSSAVASHSRKKETYVPSYLQVVAFKYGLLETIKWVSEYLENKNKK